MSMANKHQVIAHYVKQGLNLARVEQQCRELNLHRKERNALVYRLSETQYLAVYSFGVLVTYDVREDKDRARYVKMVLGESEAVTAEKAPTDDYDVIVGEDVADAVEFNQVRLREFSLEKLLIVCHVLAQSVAIDFLEREVEDNLAKFEKMNAALSRRGRVEAAPKEIMRTIGASGSMMHFVIGKLSLLDKPDNTWEDKEIETLFHSLRKTYELDDRFESLRFKLSFIQDNSARMMGILDTRRAAILEWIIILLIAFEIVMALVEKGTGLL